MSASAPLRPAHAGLPAKHALVPSCCTSKDPGPAAPPTLAGDPVEGLRRLKLATMREQAPEVLQTAVTQRWGPDEVLRSLL
jgi:hypothetical protein